MATSPQRLRFTLAEYLNLESVAEDRHEFYDGEIVAMAGGTPTHSRLAIRIGGLLDQKLRRSWQVFSSDLKLYVEQFNLVIYPDATALCDSDPVFVKSRNDVIVNPSVVVEVLSPSTARHDQTTKLEYYRSVPALQHVLIVWQDRQLVDHHARINDRTWNVTRYSGEDEIALMGIELRLPDIYDNILPSDMIVH